MADEQKKIVVVEDEGIVAQDLQQTLQRLGYVVPVTAASGEEAIKAAETHKPDLVLMDIVLQGEMDGIEAGNEIRFRFNIPILYLTAYGDQQMLERAKITEPTGYLLKPYDEKGLQAAIEMALYQYQSGRSRAELRFRGLLESAPDAIVVITGQGRIVMINAQAERMFGYTRNELFGQPVEIVMPERFRKAHTGHRATYNAHPSTRPMGIGLELAGRRKDGSEFPVEVCLSALDQGDGFLATGIIRDVTERKREEEERERLLREVCAAREQLQTLSRRLVEVQEAERRSVARELHDEIGQVLTGIKLLLERVAFLSPEGSQDILSDAQSSVDDLIARVGELSLRLRPTMLDVLGLLSTLLWHFEGWTSKTGLQVTFKHIGLEGQRFAPAVETVAYRIVQEALTNVTRHAGVNEVTVRLWANQHTLSVQVEDRGLGFDPESTLSAASSSGLAGMRERATLVGGRLTVDSSPGAGTRVTAELPLGAQVSARPADVI